MIVTMGGLTKEGEWKDYDYIPYPMLRVYWQNAVLKRLRRVLTKQEKRKNQPLLQAAYTKNAQGFYVNAPQRSRTDVQSLLAYISRYMKRGPIALKQIKMYDGESVAFSYHDKRTDQEELMMMTVEVFILSLVRHIPDKGFKMIRHYGLYSRRIKSLDKKVALAYQHSVVKSVKTRWFPNILEVTRESCMTIVH